MTQLVYIASPGHSGSTLLDLIIGSLPGVFSTGECVFFPWQVYRDGTRCQLGQDICSCGNKFSECEIWYEIIQQLSQKTAINILSHPLAYKTAIFNAPEHGTPPSISDRYFRAVCLRTLATPMSGLFIKLWQFLAQKEIANNWRLFDTISEQCSVTHVVDSSKDIVRMRLLQSHRPADTRIIVLIRDIHGVAASALKRGHDPFKAAEAWLLYYKRLFRIIHYIHQPPPFIVQYENLAKMPEATRKAIADFLGTSTPDGQLKINTRDYHLIAGNPMRYKGEIAIKSDDSWQTILTPAQKKQLSAVITKNRHLFQKMGVMSHLS